MTKRVSLKERNAQEQKPKGVDVLFNTQEEPASTNQAKTAQGEELAKVTLYIRPDQVEAMEEIQLQERKRTGKKPSKSDLTVEAFDLLIQQYSKK